MDDSKADSSFLQEPLLAKVRSTRRIHGAIARQFAVRRPQIRQREQRLGLRGVLRQPAVANLRELKVTLDHPEGMLDLRPHRSPLKLALSAGH